MLDSADIAWSMVLTSEGSVYSMSALAEFVVNVITEDIAEKMNICATDFPSEMSEVELAGLPPCRRSS